VPVSLSSITRCWPNGGDLCGWKHGFRQRAYGRIRAENLTKTPKIRWPGVRIDVQNRPKMDGVHVRRKLIIRRVVWWHSALLSLWFSLRLVNQVYPSLV